MQRMLGRRVGLSTVIKETSEDRRNAAGLRREVGNFCSDSSKPFKRTMSKLRYS